MRAAAATTLGPARGNRERIVNHQNAMQIFQQMRRAEKNSRGQSLQLAPQFARSSQMKTAKGVYNFLRDGMLYKKEPNRLQTAKELRRYISDGFGDCKHYACFAVGVLNALRIPCWFVLVSQHRYIKSPNHAYACCMIGDEVVVIDPCRSKFNNECIYFHKYNLPPRRQN